MAIGFLRRSGEGSAEAVRVRTGDALRGACVPPLGDTRGEQVEDPPRTRAAVTLDSGHRVIIPHCREVRWENFAMTRENAVRARPRVATVRRRGGEREVPSR